MTVTLPPNIVGFRPGQLLAVLRIAPINVCSTWAQASIFTARTAASPTSIMLQRATSGIDLTGGTLGLTRHRLRPCACRAPREVRHLSCPSLHGRPARCRAQRAEAGV